MSKILECSDETHMLVAKLQLEFLGKYKRKPMMTDITNIAIMEGISKVEDKLKRILFVDE